MYPEIDDTLARELRAVADHLDIPALPALPQDPPSSRFRWQPLLVAAAVVLVALGATATLLTLGPDRRIEPAPSPTPTEATERLSTAAPTVPYVVDQRLYVDGEQVPGQWFSVDGTGSGWTGIRTDGSYWWGYDATPNPIEGVLHQPPVVSPGGGYVAYVLDEDGQGILTGFSTPANGEGFGLGVEVPVSMQGIYSRAVAVTDDGVVIGGGADFQEVWRPLDDGSVAQLGDTAPGRVVIGSTDAGLIVNEGRYDSTDGTQGSPYLADLSQDGTLARTADLPAFAVLEASTRWIAWIPPGVVEGDVQTFAELRVERINGGDPGVLTPPQGWSFVNARFQWETEEHVVAAVTRGDGDRMVRCSPATEECVLLDTP